MSQIVATYTEEPNFPATNQHPSAVRYFVAPLWVDAIDGPPSQEEIDAVLSPEEAPRIVALRADANVIDIVERLKTATPAQIDAWLVNNVTNLAQARTTLGTIVKVLALYLQRT